MPLPADSQGYVLKPGGTGEYATPTTSVGFLLAMILAYFNGTLTSGGQTVGGIPVVVVSGGGGGSSVTIVGATPSGNTTSTTTNISTGGPTTIPAGALSIEFILFPSAVGTVNGATFDNTSANVIGVYRLDAPPWKPLSALTYTLSAGAGVLTVQT